MTDHCEVCHAPISWKVVQYSMNSFKKYLCMKCQMIEREKTYPKGMADLINDQIRKERYGI